VRRETKSSSWNLYKNMPKKEEVEKEKKEKKKKSARKRATGWKRLLQGAWRHMETGA
jgi:hypothetical protein